jgi:hypothetical protein
MRFSIHEHFIVGVVRPSGGWSKGRPIAYIEEDDKCVPLFDLLIPNDLDDAEITGFAGEKFRTFARQGKRITPPPSPTHTPARRVPITQQRRAAGTAEYESG